MTRRKYIKYIYVNYNAENILTNETVSSSSFFLAYAAVEMWKCYLTFSDLKLQSLGTGGFKF